jgi:hypothetical protein
MSGWGAVTWDIARAGGFTAYALLTLSVAVGLALTQLWQTPRWPRLINSEMHNFLTLLALVFTGVHVIAVWLDPFTAFGWNEVFIPFVSHYRPLWVALGIVGLYLGLAVGLSTWLRPFIGYTWWRRLHVLTLVLYGLVTVHGLATGSDTRTWWGIAIYAGSVLLVGTLFWVRLLVPATPRARSHPLVAAATAALLITGLSWTVLGPLQPGWNALANNGNGSGARVPVAGSSLTQPGQAGGSQDPFTAPFTAGAQGTLQQTGPDGSGHVTVDLHLTLNGAAQGVVDVHLVGQQSFGSGDDGDGAGGLTITSTSITLGTRSAGTLYRGELTDLIGERRLRMTALLTGAAAGARQIQLQMTLRIAEDGTLSGTVTGTPTSGGAAS